MKAEALEWLKEWQRLINDVDFEGARSLFADSVVSFGTFAEVLYGLDQLEAMQWRRIWPTLRDFKFEEPKILVFKPGIATLVVLWHSRGKTKDGGWYRRKRTGDAGPEKSQPSLHPLPSVDGTWNPSAR